MGEAQTTNVLGGFLHKISNIQNTALDRFFWNEHFFRNLS
jgi:hypothetical protein